MKFRSGLVILASALSLASAMPAQAAVRPAGTEKQHAMDFVNAHPDVVSNPATFKQYQAERLARFLKNAGHAVVQKPSKGGTVTPFGSFDYIVRDVYSITQTGKVRDNHAYPVWENTIVALPGSGGLSGTVQASWESSVSSTWNVNATIGAEASALFFSKLSLAVGGGYSRTTATKWTGATTINYNIPDGYQQTFYAYEPGYHETYRCDCLIEMSAGKNRTTIAGVADGTEAFPYMSTVFEAGPKVLY